jgi:SAM-dependent MidA family methyltransferase
VTPLAEILRAEIGRGGPISFHRFMDAALYHPRHGYYRCARDPFGKDGDFFTASQLQPVFGILIASRIRSLYHEMGEPSDFTVVELGPGRGEMGEFFQPHLVTEPRASASGPRYLPLSLDGDLPTSFRGAVFSNEFFDALPVHRVVWSGGEARESMVGWQSDRFIWVDGDPVSPEIRDYVERYFPASSDRSTAEVNLDAVRWMERISRSLESGYVFTIDYGYSARELKRFPEGTLMSYRRHASSEDVLADPGERDITAHVCFPALEGYGLRTVRFETLASTLLTAGEADQFAAALAGPDETKRRLQLKTLLFGMGETFRTLLQKK